MTTISEYNQSENILFQVKTSVLPAEDMAIYDAIRSPCEKSLLSDEIGWLVC